jgi:hypothetical protein
MLPGRRASSSRVPKGKIRSSEIGGLGTSDRWSSKDRTSEARVKVCVLEPELSREGDRQGQNRKVHPEGYRKLVNIREEKLERL